MRVGKRQAAGFCRLLENMNIALFEAEPEWYAKHFSFTRPRVHINGNMSTNKCYASWHKLVLEELRSLTSPKPKAVLGNCKKKPNEIPLPPRTPLGLRTMLHRRDSSRSCFCDKLESPPHAEAQDDLYLCVVTRWCPWFSRTFGMISEENLKMLMVKLLRVHDDETTLLLELLAMVLLVLKLPNAPRPPSCRDQSLATSFLLSPAAE
ncbi:hypothetical protein Q5P01_012005 [Channa striata]|uniref:Uncharacterized protein n=1 Tax=Channa striata TaxID=64152 RepID=A0AA88MNV3_CHASR|nr:hypothetical protein Q5P01_012005 [Channa striata]